MFNKWHLVIAGGYALVVWSLAACGGSLSSGTFVWIEVPVDGLNVSEGESVQVEGHAANSEGIDKVEIWINGTLNHTVESPSFADGLAHFAYTWTPPDSGEYHVQAIAFSPAGEASESDSTRIFVGEQLTAVPDLAIVRVEAMVAGELDDVAFCHTQVALTNAGEAPIDTAFEVSFSLDGVSETPQSVAGGLSPGEGWELTYTSPFSKQHEIVVTLDSEDRVVEGDETNNVFSGSLRCGEMVEETDPTITPVLEAAARFWAEPAEIVAGACTLLKWQVENAESVIFGGTEQVFEGEYGVCLCENERYTLTVIHLDGSEEKIPFDIVVTGACITPTVVDTTPPPAPSPQVPANGLILSCRSWQDLSWQPVSDPSGIAEYQLQAERHSGDNNWQSVSGSTYTGIGGKTMNLSVECGWTYRWRVRAVDGEGNVGSWSGWSTFIDSLS